MKRSVPQRASLRLDHVRGHTFVGSWLSADSMVIDLGMNVGKFSYTVHQRYGCTIVGAEANPMLALQMTATDKVVCRNVAITYEQGYVNFFVDATNPEASTGTFGDEYEGQPIQVRGVSYPDFVHASDVKDIDLLKIDIEGAEMELFQKSPPDQFERVKQISVEFHAFRRPSLCSEIKLILTRMKDAGFYWIDFSRNYENVLMVNERFAKLSSSQKLYLTIEKYRLGLGRKVARISHGAGARPQASLGAA
jgi:FkbM family methyltransferase